MWLRNEGLEIPEADRTAIFDRGFRSVAAREIVPIGTGLGLFLGRVIMTLLGGYIQLLRSTRDETVFEIAVPLARPSGGPGQKRTQKGA